MASEWKEATVGDIAAATPNALVGGPFGSNLVSRDYVNEGIPVIRGQNMSSRWVSGEFVFVTEKKAKSLSANLARPGDIVFTQRGTLGQVSLVPQGPFGQYLVSQSQMKLTVDRNIADPLFFYYFFSSAEQQDYIRQNAIQTGVPHTNLGILRATPVVLPPLSEQHAIARILGSLDDKLELNRRMNATLEAMAQAIFTSWFVDFDPVRAKMEGREPTGMDAETAALFPDGFGEVDGREVPVGWRAGTFGDVAENLRNGIQSDEIDPNTNYISLAEMPRNCIALDTWVTAENIDSNKFEFREGQILFGKLRPYFHKVGIAPVNGVCSTDILVVVPKSRVCYGLVLMHISSDPFIDYVTQSSTGTRMPRTNWDAMAGYSIIIPSVEILESFERVINPMLQRIQHNVRQSRTLAALRDTLLPKLISGEVRVPVGEEQRRESATV
jgi:type I restriction enzyme S subunit